MSIQLVGQNTKDVTAQFQRLDGHNLEVGRIVIYRLGNLPFQVMAHRIGIQVMGTSPLVGEEGVRVFQGVLSRALRHHNHLKSFASGVPQEVLEERVIDAEETAAYITAKGETIQ